MRIVALGTSLTAQAAWPSALELALNGRLAGAASVTRIARAGATSAWGRQQVEAIIALRPDVVLIELHANDAALHRRISVARSHATLCALAEALRQALPGARLIGMTMNPVRGPRRWVRPWLGRYLRGHRQALGQQGGEWLDFSPGWGELPRTQLRAAIPDGLHPVPAAANAVMIPALLDRLAAPREAASPARRP